EVVGFCARGVAGVDQLRSYGHGDVLCAAQDIEVYRLALLVREVSQQSGDGAYLMAIEAGDLVIRLQACAIRRTAWLRLENLDRRVLLFGIEPSGDSRIGVHALGGNLGRYSEYGVCALAIVEVGEGNRLVGIDGGLLANVVPRGVVDGVEPHDGVAGLDAGLRRGGGGRDVIGDGGAGLKGADLKVGHVSAGHEAQGEQDVCRGARD